MSNYQIKAIAEVAPKLEKQLNELSNPADVLKSKELKALYGQIAKLPQAERASFGTELNRLKNELEYKVSQKQSGSEQLQEIDLSAPFDVNVDRSKRPHLIDTEYGSTHPLMTELETITSIYKQMGFSVVESRQIDDDFHMFKSLNFPEGHPARDDYDTFVTADGLIAPAHTSTMQHRVPKANLTNLRSNQPIAYVIPGRVYRNEDLDARHEHTFYQLEGIYVDKGVNTGNLVATLKTFLEIYFKSTVEIKIQPFYFPFTEPSFELISSCPFCKKAGCKVCSYSGWIELLGCGMIHPNVLKMAGIDPTKFTGFAWGGGIERLVMIKYDIDDIRYFESGRLDFLRQFS